MKAYKGTYNQYCMKKKFEVGETYTIDKNGNLEYWADANDYHEKYSFDKKGNMILIKDSNGFWEKYHYDEEGLFEYSKDCEGRIVLNKTFCQTQKNMNL